MYATDPNQTALLADSGPSSGTLLEKSNESGEFTYVVREETAKTMVQGQESCWRHASELDPETSNVRPLSNART